MPPSYEEMVCDSCMESHDFLRLYQLHTNPTTVEKEHQLHSSRPLEVTDKSESSSVIRNGSANGAKCSSSTGEKGVVMSDSSSRKVDTAVTDSGSGTGLAGGANLTVDGDTHCELSRRQAVAGLSFSSYGELKGAGFFDKNWRSQLCHCSTCKVHVEENFVVRLRTTVKHSEREPTSLQRTVL